MGPPYGVDSISQKCYGPKQSPRQLAAAPNTLGLYDGISCPCQNIIGLKRDRRHFIVLLQWAYS